MGSPTAIKERSRAKVPDVDTKAEERVADADLIEAIEGRDQRALAKAYSIYGHAVYSRAYGVLQQKALAEDVTHDVFIRLWTRAGRFDPARGSLGTFLCMDARYRTVDLPRSERARPAREKRNFQLEAATGVSCVSEGVADQATFEDVRRTLALLRPEERDPIALSYFDDLSYRQVAEMLGLPEGTVKSRIRSGLANLRDRLAVAGFEASLRP